MREGDNSSVIIIQLQYDLFPVSSVKTNENHFGKSICVLI